MAIDLDNERIYPACELSKLMREKWGPDKSDKTLIRWMQTGYKGVILESVPVGEQLHSSLEALKRFFERLSEEGAE